MLDSNGFEIIIADDSNHKRVFAEIYYEGLFIALISEERGDGLFDIETPSLGLVEERVLRKFPLEGFQKAINDACCKLHGT